MARRVGPLFVALTAGAALVTTVRADALDPFGSVPTRETAAPGGDGVTPADLQPGADGSLAYTFPIEVPTGRGGMAPALALRYSSTAALRGGVAVGWSLDLPHIEVDPAHPGTWTATLDGASGHLVAATDQAPSGTQTFRLEHDDLFARFEALPDGNGGYSTWTVRIPDGRTLTFRANLAYGDNTSRWNLTSQTDGDGNEIDYTWSEESHGPYIDWILQSIQYTSNPAAGLAAFAKVDFAYAPVELCAPSNVPIGAEASHRLPTAIGLFGMHGSRRLTDVVTSVHDTPSSAWRQVRDVKLSYDASALACTGPQAPLRYLTRIDQTATSPLGVATASPPITFGYGPHRPTFAATTTLPAMQPTASVLPVGDKNGPENALMDLDGDGLVDYMSIQSVPTGCELHVYRGKPGGGFVTTPIDMPMPSAIYVGSGAQIDNEICSMTHQRTWIEGLNYNNITGNTQTAIVDVAYTFVDWDGDGRIDVLASIVSGDAPGVTGTIRAADPVIYWHTFNLNNNNAMDQQSCDGAGGDYDTDTGICTCDFGEEMSNGTDGSPECTSSNWGTTTGGGGGGSGNPFSSFLTQVPEQGTVQDTFLWRLFPNDGTSFLTHPSTFNAPAPLWPSSAETGVAEMQTRPLPPLIADIDGDGLPDVITTQREGEQLSPDPAWMIGFPQQSIPGPTTLFVYHGTGSALAMTPDSWSVPAFISDVDTATETDGTGSATIDATKTKLVDHLYITDQLAVVDVDGDGFEDLIYDRHDPLHGYANMGLHVLWNGGSRGFTLTGMSGTSSIAAVTRRQADLPDLWPSNDYFSIGQRGTTSAFVDVDHDGLPDRLELASDLTNVAITGTRGAAYGFGDGIGALDYSLGSAWDAAKRRVIAEGDQWRYRGELQDLTGDGIPDLVSVDPYGALTIRTEPAGEAPLRLLVSIDNGRGATTSVTYGPSTDPTLATLNGATLPSVRWLVRGIATSPGASQPTLAKSFTYASPMRGASSRFDAPTHFLGFASVTANEAAPWGSPIGRQKIRTYSGGVGADGRPRLVGEAVLASAGPGLPLAPIHYTQSAYTNVPVLGGAASFTYRATSVEHVCATGDTLASCQANALTTTQTEGWNAVEGASMYVDVSSDVTIRPGESRRIYHSYQTWNTATEHRAVDVQDETDAMTPLYSMPFAVPIPMARTSYQNLDPHHHPQSILVWTSSDTATAETTTRSYDTAGNMIATRKPRQGPTGLATTIAFDPFGLYPAVTTNELGHVISTTHDIGTGALLTKLGPNSRQLAMGPQFEPEVWTIDGFGRPLTHAVPTDPAGGAATGYATFVVEKDAYIDTIPNQHMTTTMLDYASKLAPRVVTGTYDGLGRLVTSTTTGGTAPYSLTYAYDGAGNRRIETRPDPADDTGRVTYTFDHDGLGRVTTFTRPDGTGTTTTYGPLDQTVQETSPVDGPGRRTQYVQDHLGRLVSVHEYDNPTPGMIATTSYTYDDLDRASQIVDADGTSTSIGFDWANRRVLVYRNSRSWLYGYDNDGNLISRQTPLPTGATAAQYTSTWTYDALDRISTHIPAARGMTTAQMQHLGIAKTSYTYDQYANGVGQLSYVANAYDQKALYHDVHHDLSETVYYLHLPAATSLGFEMAWTKTFSPSHQMIGERWDDSSQVAVAYDFRDQPQSVQWLDQSLTKPAWKNVAVYHRAVAGPPRSRTTDYGSARDWHYDHLGRVIYDHVYLANGTSKSERTYGYDGFGELRAISGENDGLTADATFAYDAAHRLTSASGPGLYEASFAYSGAGNVLRATVTGSGVPAQDAVYAYSAAEPQAVQTLSDVTSNSTIAQMTYDPAGNLSAKTAGNATESLTWDGDDLLREVNGSAGDFRYFYDENGQRFAAIGPSGITVWLGDNEMHYSSTGTPVTRWMNLGAGDAVGRVQNKTALELVYADALGSTMLSLDPSGATQGSFTYGAFGEVIAQVGAAFHPAEFNGKESDGTGLRYYGARYYDPQLMRWTSADPLYRVLPEKSFESPQRGNWYAFSLNNPVRFMDPDGRDPTIEDVLKEWKEQQARVEEEERKADVAKLGAGRGTEVSKGVDRSGRPVKAAIESAVSVSLSVAGPYGSSVNVSGGLGGITASVVSTSVSWKQELPNGQSMSANISGPSASVNVGWTHGAFEFDLASASIASSQKVGPVEGEFGLTARAGMKVGFGGDVDPEQGEVKAQFDLFFVSIDVGAKCETCGAALQAAGQWADDNSDTIMQVAGWNANDLF